MMSLYEAAQDLQTRAIENIQKDLGKEHENAESDEQAKTQPSPFHHALSGEQGFANLITETEFFKRNRRYMRNQASTGSHRELMNFAHAYAQQLIKRNDSLVNRQTHFNKTELEKITGVPKIDKKIHTIKINTLKGSRSADNFANTFIDLEIRKM
jgi:hypothetical protein